MNTFENTQATTSTPTQNMQLILAASLASTMQEYKRADAEATANTGDAIAAMALADLRGDLAEIVFDLLSEAGCSREDSLGLIGALRAAG